jgi:hypothetical protein
MHPLTHLLAASSILLLVFGCSDKPVPPAVATALTAPPQLLIRRVPRLALERTHLDGACAKSIWEIRVAEFRESQIENLRLKNLFDQLAQKNSDHLSEDAFVQLAGRETNITLNIRSAVHPGICSSDTASNLLQALAIAAGVDVLTAPAITLSGSKAGQVRVAESFTVILEAGAPGRNPRAANLTKGFVSDLRVLGSHGEADVLEFDSSLRQFKGYSDPPNSHGKAAAHPILDLAAVRSVAELLPGEMLLLATAPEERVTITEERVPRLSDIPVIGKLFIKRASETNRLRQVIMVRRRDL